MNNLDSGITNEAMSRRSFLAGSAAVAGGVALAAAGLTVPTNFAFAANALAPGNYTVNANLFISKNLVLIKKNAYFTNPSDPNDAGVMPQTPVTHNNATMHVGDDGLITVTVPLVNECFMLLSASSGDTITVADTKTRPAIEKYRTAVDNVMLDRIYEITFTFTSMAGTYVLGECREYAAYANPPFPMNQLVPGYLGWEATLSVDFSTATAVPNNA